MHDIYQVELQWIHNGEIKDEYRGKALLLSYGIPSGKGERTVVLQFVRDGIATTTAAFSESVLKEKIGTGKMVLIPDTS